MPVDYNNELEKIEALLVSEEYSKIIKEVGWLFEISLKDLYKQQIAFFERNIDNPILAVEYDKLREVEQNEFQLFEIERESFARIGWLFSQSKFNNLIELRINSPLTFSHKMPWKEIREMRNLVTHNRTQDIDRNTALSFIEYIRTYISETKLATKIILVGELKCYSCEELVEKNWLFCPKCGIDLSTNCKKCGTRMHSGWVVCPQCNTPRAGVKVEKPNIVYKYYCQAVWSDGYLSKEENVFLKKKRDELGLDSDAAEIIESKYAPINAIRFRDSIEGCLTDGTIDDDEKQHLRNKADELSILHDLANSIFLACVSVKIKLPLFDN